MATETTFYLSPASNDGDFNWCSPFDYTGIDDPRDAVGVGLGPTPTSCANFNAANNGSSYRNSRGSWGLTSPQAGVSINWIRVHLHSLLIVRQGGSWVAEPRTIALVRPGGASTYYASSLRTIVDTGGRLITSGSYMVTDLPLRNANTASWESGSTGPAHAYWQFSTNPVTAVAWTVSDLQNLLVSWTAGDTSITTSPASIGMIQLPPGASGSNFDVRVGAVYVEVNANVAAVSIEAQRAKASAYLRVHRDPRETFEMEVPLHALPADVGDVIPVTHSQAPTVDGLGWGREPWSRRYALILEKALKMGTRVWRVRAMDMRLIHTRLWFPAITDQAYTEEGQGIPYLDSGAGRVITRENGSSVSTYGYAKKQAEDTLYAQVPQDTERWTPEGLAIFRELQSVLKNNSFSQGSGSTFTDWTQVTSGAGGTFAESTSDYLFDATGLRRAAKLTSSATSGATVGLSQAVSLLGNYNIRAHIIHKKLSGTTTDYLVWRLQRSSDSQYWDEGAGAWTATITNNPLNVSGTDGVVEETRSGVIPCDTSTTTYTLAVYAAHTASDAHAMLYYYANLWYASGTDPLAADRPPFVTTTAATFEGGDVLYFDNPTSGRCYDPSRGTAMLTWKSAFDQADLDAGVERNILANYVDASNYDILYFERTDASSCAVTLDRIVSGSSIGQASVALTGDDRPGPGSVVKVAARWQATDGENGDVDYAMKVFVSTDGRDPVTATGTCSGAAAAGTAKLYLGTLDGDGPIDGYMRDLDVSPYVLTDEEIYRRLGV